MTIINSVISGEFRFVPFVNTIMGCIADIETPSVHGGGKTYPGAVCPFGMVQLSPDTITGGDNGPGYSYHHNTIEGFSFNHLSGIGWYGDLGNLQVMPTIGQLRYHSGSNEHALFQPDEEGWRSTFDHETEKTEAGYYAVTLDRYGIRTEMTTTQRTGIIRFTFPVSEESKVLLNLSRRIAGRSTRQQITVIGEDTVEGWIDCPSEGGGFGHGRGNVTYRLHFHGKFDTPWQSCGLWNNGTDLGSISHLEEEDIGFYANYSTQEGQTILFKAGISYVSIEGARQNLHSELSGWDFDQVRLESQFTWEQALSCIQLEGASDKQKEIFYSALYRTLLDPRDASDTNGQYFGADKQYHESIGFTCRTIFSGWDVFRSQFPLLTLIRPDVVNDEMNTLIQIARDTGKTFPRWELLGTETGCMIGDPGVVVLVDAYRKGIRNYDVDAAYEICKRTAIGERSTRIGAADMNELGYVPCKISVTLENVYADWCISKFAEDMKDIPTASMFTERAGNYRHLFDPSVGWMRRKNRDGSWMEWDGKYDNRGCVESNVFQQHWFVPHDVEGLIDLMGLDRFTSELEALFEGADLSALWNNNYNHSNEPCHHIPHMFIHAGQPWRTQYWVRQIQNKAYRTGPFGYCGNEDVGQMSAWYILTALGIHQMAPGEPIYMLNTPLHQAAEIRLNRQYHSCANSDKLRIETDVDPILFPYIHSVSLNGNPIERAWVTWDELTAGGVLRFELGKDPNEQFGTVNLPLSFTKKLTK